VPPTKATTAQHSA